MSFVEDILNKAIGDMTGTSSNKDVVIDLSEFFEEWSYTYSTSCNREGYKEYLINSLSFFDREILDGEISSTGIVNAGTTERFIVGLIKKYPRQFANINNLLITNKKFTDKVLLEAHVVHKAKLSTLGDYYEKDGTAKDTVVGHVDNDIVLRKYHKVTFDNLLKENTNDFIISIDTVFDYENTNEIPKGIKCKTPIKLYSGILRDTIVAESNRAVITVNGDLTIDTELPIDVCKCETLILNGCGTLRLKCSEYQPCIGVRTNSGLSYGRWQIASYMKCKQICISGLHVICEPSEKDFSIGRFGTNDLPEIQIWNNGKLDCPEIKGNRVLEKEALPPSGSTKISGKPVYRID